MSADDYSRAYGLAARQQTSSAYSYSNIIGRKSARQMVRDIAEIVVMVEGVPVAAEMLYQAADAMSGLLVLPHVEMPPIEEYFEPLSPHVEAAPIAETSSRRVALRWALPVLHDVAKAAGFGFGAIAALYVAAWAFR